MNENELALAGKLGSCWNDFCKLDGWFHPSDKDDFVFHIHALQNIVMSRVTARDYPHVFLQESDASISCSV